MNNAVLIKKKFTFKERWAPELESDGHVQVSTFFLENYHQLKPYDLTHGEAMFVIHLMQHKWGTDAPFPAYKTIAQRMGVSTKTARRFAASLEQKKYLHRRMRVGATNRFDLTNLLAALVSLKTNKPALRRTVRQAKA
jgi:DNA-binding transcriptional regulator YhcF (GntR family)